MPLEYIITYIVSCGQNNLCTKCLLITDYKRWHLQSVINKHLAHKLVGIHEINLWGDGWLSCIAAMLCRKQGLSIGLDLGLIQYTGIMILNH